MANYFVIGNTFRPYSFDELIRPYQIYGEAYKEQEAALDAAREREFKDTLPEGSLAQQIYNQSTSSLRDIANELATTGLTTSLRGRIKSVARDYSSTMDRLTSASAKLQSELDRRAKAGENIAYRDTNLSIDKYLSGPVATDTGVDLVAKQKQAAIKAKSVAQSLFSNPNWTRVNNQYYQLATQNGLSYDAFDWFTKSDKEIDSNRDFSNETKAGIKAFKKIYEEEMSSIGTFDNPTERAKVENAIISGMYSGLAAPTYSYQANRGYLNEAQREELDQSRKLFDFTYDTNEAGQITGYSKEYIDFLEKKALLKKDSNTKVSTTSTSSSQKGGGKGYSLKQAMKIDKDGKITFLSGSTASELEELTPVEDINNMNTFSETTFKGDNKRRETYSTIGNTLIASSYFRNADGDLIIIPNAYVQQQIENDQEEFNSDIY